jgi:hypothetical protein
MCTGGSARLSRNPPLSEIQEQIGAGDANLSLANPDRREMSALDLPPDRELANTKLASYVAYR